MIAMYDKDNAATAKALADKGGTDYTLPAAEETRWAEALKPVVAAWVADRKTKGQPMGELMNIVREETKKRNLFFPY
jgi:hypothetical protein